MVYSIPKIVLMLTTVGFLVLLIVLKWLNSYDNREF